uniref:Uncharacterized protein n=1 Tax=Eutreptiella gymnastica TaxID=73025 RepID=A0A7S1HZU7_9EUGL|mmetsp:Transcript_117748/g.205022  ORF Transcript_117748/g.205022 Transcript_117748/m.205022 type:complete len:102 (+) Transcript_117748:270-575(+)
MLSLVFKRSVCTLMPEQEHHPQQHAQTSKKALSFVSANFISFFAEVRPDRGWPSLLKLPQSIHVLLFVFTTIEMGWQAATIGSSYHHLVARDTTTWFSCTW